MPILSMLILFVIVLTWGTLHSLLASKKVKEWACRGFGKGAARYYRLGYNLFAGISFIPVLIAAAWFPDKRLYLVHLPWSALMIIIDIAAIAMLLIGLRQTDMWEFLGLRQVFAREPSNRPDCTAGTRDGTLITNGLYRFVRHPLYSAGILFLWMTPLMTTRVFAINLGLTLYILAGTILEERKLKEDFGESYVEYARRTPRYIPFLPGNKKGNKRLPPSV